MHTVHTSMTSTFQCEFYCISLNDNIDTFNFSIFYPLFAVKTNSCLHRLFFCSLRDRQILKWNYCPAYNTLLVYYQSICLGYRDVISLLHKCIPICHGTWYHKQWTLLAMLISYLYQQLSLRSILLFLSITIVSLPYAIRFYHLLHIQSINSTHEHVTPVFVLVAR